MKTLVLAKSTKLAISSVVLLVLSGCGGGGSTPTQTPTINVAPIITSVANPSVTENQINAATIVATDANGDTLTYSLSGTDASLFSVTNTGVVTFNTAPDFENPTDSGTDNIYNFTATVSDSNLSSSQDMNITVTDVAENTNTNNAPTATFSSATTTQNTTYTGTLTASDADGDTLTFLKVSDPSHGTVTISSVGAVTYTPNNNFSGTDTFTYKVNDGTVDSSAQTVTMTVTSVNHAPVTQDATLTFDEDTTGTVQLVGTDADGDSLTYYLNKTATSGTASISSTGLFTYVPNANYNGTEQIGYIVNDGTVNSSSTITIITTAVDDAPVGTLSAFSTQKNTSHTGVLSYTDVDGGVATFYTINQPLHGTVTENSGNFTYTPTQNYVGTDTFLYTVSNAQVVNGSNVYVSSAQKVVTVTVTAPTNSAPVATTTSFTPTEDTVFNGQLAGSDADGDTLTYAVATPLSAVAGTMTISSTGALSYTPAANFNGLATFSYKVNDGTVDSAERSVSLTVAAVNDAPVVFSRTTSTDEDNQVNISLSAIDPDQGASATFFKVTDPSHGSIVINASTGSATYTPNLNFVGTDSYTYKANDGVVDSTTETITITVTPVNDAPVIETTHANIDVPLNSGTRNYDLNVSDVDGDTLTVTVDSNDTSLITVTKNWTNTLNQASYNGVALDFNLSTEVNASGTAEITITVDDGDVNTTQIFEVVILNTFAGGTFRGKTYQLVTSPQTSRVWLDRNLGADQVCTSATNTQCRGDYYQWGRKTNGHQLVSSTTTNTLSSTVGVNENGSTFVINQAGNQNDWTTADSQNGAPLRSAYWSKTDGTSVCPVGFRVPVGAEFTAESILRNSTDAFASFFKGGLSGKRAELNGAIGYSAQAFFWTSEGTNPIVGFGSVPRAKYYRYTTVLGQNGLNDTRRGEGIPIRCIKD